jgi:predicted ATPase
MKHTEELTLTTNQQNRPAVVMHGADGALYVVRNEGLELCQMNNEDAASAEMVLQNHQAEFTLETAVFQPITRADGNVTPMALKLTTQRTIMCCWSSLCFEN